MANEQETPAKEPGFDDRLAALERIVEELEDGELGLEDAIARYQEGIQLLKSCHGTLESTRRRVEELDGDAAVVRPFADDPDFDGAT